ncbi:fasciclin-like arabinogalactan protein 14 [Oryza brachyantha]|uniref:FAS1 domain-containing protein n=1 Tax=Oryza brachyantha TaxID=4533 RepID=J3LWG4_ORYBR|nr:fasciclin-like arabinogalactan protein 14 [Oryza brachyantha]
MAASPMAALAGLVVALAFASAAAAAFKFNVTEILDEFPEFAVFNGLLSQTGLAGEINRRQAVTVLVVDDSAAAAITSLPDDARRKVLAVQVLLDYYDPVKLDGIRAKTALLATMLPAAGRAGLVNYTESPADEQMAFGSAEPGAPVSSQLVKVVASRPYNLSVMQLTAPIVPPSIASSFSSSGGGSGRTPPYSPAATADGSSTTTTSEVTVPASGTDAATVMSDYDDDPIAPAAAVVDTPTTTTSPSNERNGTADAAADGTRTSAGGRVVAGASVGAIMAGLLVFIWI